MTLFYAIPAWGDNVTIDGIVYRLLEDNKAAVTYDVSYLSKTSITIPPTITCETVDYTVVSIDAETFKNCSSLETITLPEHLGSVGENAFTGSGIKHITFNCATIGQRWFNNIKSQILTVNLGATVQTIGDAAFSGFENVENITIPNGVTTIENLAFEGWKKLTTIETPSTVTSISATSFLGCINLTTITVTGSSTYQSSYNAIIETSTNKLILGCKGTTTIPASVTTIGDDAFRGVGITSITIPASVTTLGKRAFNNTNITAITIPAAVTSIGEGAFRSCTGLTNIKFPNGLSTIESYSFNSCSNITSLAFPAQLKTIKDHAFSDCTNLASVSFQDQVETIEEFAFENCTHIANIYSSRVTPPSVTNNSFASIYLLGSLS